MSVESHVRWVLRGPADRPIYEVVRVTRTIDHLAGPFTTKTQAEKWMARTLGQPTLDAA